MSCTLVDQALDVLGGGAAEVPRDGELQGARRDREVERRGGRLRAEERGDQAGGKAVASPDAIHHAHHVPPAPRKRAGGGVVQRGAPALLARAQDLPLRDRDDTTPVALSKERAERVARRI